MIISNRQSLFDIAIQELGTVTAVVAIALANSYPVTKILLPGQQVIIPEYSAENKQMASYYANNNIKPATGLTAQAGGTDENYYLPQILPSL